MLRESRRRGGRVAPNARLRAIIVLPIVACLALLGAGPVAAAPKPLPAPKNVQVAADSTTSITVSFAPVSGASSYTVLLYGATGQNARTFPNAVPASTSITGLATCTAYRVSVQAISASGAAASSVQSGKVGVSTQCNAALVPAFGAVTPTSDGFTVQITNYDPLFTWAGSVTAGSVAIGDSGLATVSGLTTDTTETLTVTTTRSTYDQGLATVSGARSVAPSTPSRWIGAGDFTVELWAKPTVDWSSGRQELFAITPTALNARMDIVFEAGKWLVLEHTWSTAPQSDAMAPPSVGQWTHVALTRQSNTMRLYVAGQKVAESTGVADFSGFNLLMLGADVNSSWCGCNLATGLLSNVRVIDGSALYTGTSLTVPTATLTAVPGTTFLLNQALGNPTAGSVVLDGTMRYEQIITTGEGGTTVSPLAAYQLGSRGWQATSVVLDSQSPFAAVL